MRCLRRYAFAWCAVSNIEVCLRRYAFAGCAVSNIEGLFFDGLFDLVPLRQEFASEAISIVRPSGNAPSVRRGHVEGH